MKEIEPNGINPKPDYRAVRKLAMIKGGIGGSFIGAGAFIAANAAGIREAGQIGELALATSTVALTGVSISNISLEEAERCKDNNQIVKMRLKIAQACIEYSVGLALVAGIVTSDASDPIKGLIGAGIASVVTSLEVINEWTKRTKEFPYLYTPHGNSTIINPNFPERVDGFKLPPVFETNSIKDLLEFRQLNKKTILKWSPDDIPTIGNRISTAESVAPLLTSVFLLPDVRHYPAMNPDDKNKVVLMDDTGEIVASQIKDSEPVWANPTIFEYESSLKTRIYQEAEWDYWRDKSWKHTVVILAQYQDPGSGFSFSKVDKIDRAVDQYYLLDIFSDDNGPHRRKEKEKIKIKTKKPIPVYQT